MADTRILFHFDEADGVPASDAAGGLLDLVTPADLTTPESVDAALGRGRDIVDGSGLEATEAVVGATRLRRDLTVEAVLADFVAGQLTDGTRTIASRGKGRLTVSERRLWTVSLVTTGAPGAPSVILRMMWQAGSTTNRNVDSDPFVVPEGPLYVAVTRRWVSTSSVLVNFYVNGLHISEGESTFGGIDEGDGGTVLIGHDRASFGGAGSNFLEHTLDELRVSSVVRSPEEIKHTYRTLFVHPQLGYELMQAHLPPGEAYSTDPESAIQRELQVEGGALGVAWGHTEELEEYALPDRAFRLLSRWETVLRLKPQPSDTIDQRRTRLVAHLRKTHGYQKSEIVKALAAILDLEEADVEILRNSNILEDNFDGAAFHSRWMEEPNDGLITFVAANDRFDIVADTIDARWTGEIDVAPRIRTTVPEGDECEVMARLDIFPDVAEDMLAGIYYSNRITDEAHLFGITYDGADPRFAHRTIIDGVLTVHLAIAIAVPAAPFYLRMKRTAAGLLDMQFSETGIYGPWTTAFAGVATIDDPHWCGVVVCSDVNPCPALLVSCDFFRIWTPRGRLPFQWFVYRDPALAGDPDLEGAQAVVNRMTPAHSDGRVIEATTFLAGDEDCLAGREPVGER